MCWPDTIRGYIFLATWEWPDLKNCWLSISPLLTKQMYKQIKLYFFLIFSSVGKCTSMRLECTDLYVNSRNQWLKAREGQCININRFKKLETCHMSKFIYLEHWSPIYLWLDTCSGVSNVFYYVANQLFGGYVHTPHLVSVITYYKISVNT